MYGIHQIYHLLCELLCCYCFLNPNLAKRLVNVTEGDPSRENLQKKASKGKDVRSP